MNWEELKSNLGTTTSEYDTVQDLVSENEEHFIDLIQNTEQFLQDIRDSGFHPSDLPPNNRSDIQNTEESNARRYYKELDSIIDEWNSESPAKNLRAFSPQLNAYSSKKEAHKKDFKNDFLNQREASLLERINQLEKQIHTKEKDSKSKYDSIISDLERKLMTEAQLHNDARRNYKVLAQTSINFQNALKDFQKAVRSKIDDIPSYK